MGAFLMTACRALNTAAGVLVAVLAVMAVHGTSHAQAPANNVRANAQRVNFDGASNMWMMHFATNDGVVSSSCGGGNDQDVWFIATAAETGSVWARLCYVDWTYTVQVFRSDNAHTLGTEVVCRTVPAGGGCGGTQLATWNALAGESFLIRAACDPQLFYGGGFTLTTGAGAPATPVPPPPSRAPTS